MSSTIVPISASDAGRLCSGQVITTLVDAVKELLDNSLDSGANQVEIRLHDHGLESIEVVDDGHGIPEQDLDKVCEKYATSKITSFNDLDRVKSFGFRGEALSSLASLSSSVRILTKTEGLEIGFKVEYDREGKVVKTSRYPRTRGTTVTVIQLFSALPVRQKHFKEKAKQQLAKLVTVVKGYSLANTGIKIVLSNQCGNEKKQLLNISPAANLKQRIHGLISHEAIFSEISKVEIFEEVVEEFGIETNEKTTTYQDAIDFTGFISNPKHGKSNSDLQFLSVNSRPIDYPKLAKIVNQVFRSFDPTGSGSQYPILVLNITIPPSYVDVNVTPDKRTVFISNENVLWALVKSSILKLFSQNVSSFEQTKYSLSSSQMTVISPSDRDDESPNASMTSPAARTPFFRAPYLNPAGSRQITDFYEPAERPARLSEQLDRLTTSAQSLVSTTPSGTNITPLAENQFRSASTLIRESVFEVPFVGASERRATSVNPFQNNTPLTGAEDRPPSRRRSLTPDFESSYDRRQPKRRRQLSLSPPRNNSSRFESADLTSTFQPMRTSSPVPPRRAPSLINNSLTLGNASAYGNTSGNVSFNGNTSAESYKTVIDDQPGPRPSRRKIKCSFDFDKMLKSVPSENSPPKVQASKFTANLDIANDEEAIEMLNKEMKKSDFKEMRIVGQFNKGFIITQLGSTLFVIDQHASDERKNFDELLESTELETQTLIQPIPLTLTAYEEYLITENIQVFTKNGFKLTYGEDRNLGSRFTIDAVPSFGDQIFGVKEVDEILDVIKESPTAVKSMRPTSVKEALAMKACRKSIMIGDTLTRQEMKKLVEKMSETSYPWTCAHGRPTVRCLGNIENFQK